jgi:hypothetical protein
MLTALRLKWTAVRAVIFNSLKSKLVWRRTGQAGPDVSDLVLLNMLEVEQRAGD